MIIEKTINGKELTFRLFGKLDTTTAPMLHAELTEALAKAETLILDLADLAHLSSAGLRVLLMVQLAMHPPGKMIVKNANETVMEIFEQTGFFNLLNIE